MSNVNKEKVVKMKYQTDDLRILDVKEVSPGREYRSSKGWLDGDDEEEPEVPLRTPVKKVEDIVPIKREPEGVKDVPPVKKPEPPTNVEDEEPIDDDAPPVILK